MDIENYAASFTSPTDYGLTEQEAARPARQVRADDGASLDLRGGDRLVQPIDGAVQFPEGEDARPEATSDSSKSVGKTVGKALAGAVQWVAGTVSGGGKTDGKGGQGDDGLADLYDPGLSDEERQEKVKDYLRDIR